MEGLNQTAIIGLISVAVLGGISLAAKETIGNLWAAIAFRLNPMLKKGIIIEAKVQGELLKGVFQGFVGSNRVHIKDEQQASHLILIEDLRKTTIKILNNPA